MAGDAARASTLLASSASGIGEERFIDAESRITSVVATPNADGTYKVEAEIVTAKGPYYDTFTVSRGAAGYAIADHYAIKVQ